jgi:hypothetical protein
LIISSIVFIGVSEHISVISGDIVETMAVGKVVELLAGLIFLNWILKIFF